MGLILLCAVTVVFCMFGRRLSGTILTAPMIFMGLGLLLHKMGLFEGAESEEALHLVAELALILLLFLDAAKIDLTVLQRSHTWPLRMLVLGLPLAWVLGTAAISFILPDWPLVFAALAAAILTPTDAALGQAVISNPDVPERPRRALTVESGLNDGLALPLILALASIGASMMAPDPGTWLWFGAKQIVLGPLIGAGVGWAGGRLLVWAKDHETTAPAFEGVGAIALAGGAYVLAGAVDGNGFIAAFTGGLVFGHQVRDRCPFVYEFTENEGQMLAWGAFLLLGVGAVPDAMAHLGWPELTVILASLFLTRPMAIWLSLTGTDAAPLTRAFFGWFGPRGLATALFAFTAVPQIDGIWGEKVLHLALNAVWISVLLHGITAAPGARLYARLITARWPRAEMRPIRGSAIRLKAHKSP